MTTTPQRRIRRRVATIAVVSLIGIGSVGTLAYFIARGTGTAAGNVQTGTAGSAPVTVVLGTPQGSPLTPGSAPQTLTVQVHNAGAASVEYQLSITVRSDASGGIYDTTSAGFVDGCQVSWFTATLSNTGVITQPSNTLLNEGTATVALTDSGTDQSACESLTPEIDVTAS